MLSGLPGALPAKTDMYDPHSPWLGNSKLKEAYLANGGKCTSDDEDALFEPVDWLYRLTDYADLRQMLVKCVDGQ